MKQLLYILFGAAFAASVSFSLGRLLVDRLRLRLDRVERRLFAFLLGAAALSLAVFATCALHAAHRGVFLAFGALAIWLAWRRRAAGPVPSAPQPLAPLWRWLFLAVFLGYGVMYFVYALAPEMSPDGSTYHLGFVSRLAREHAFHPILTDFYKNMPAGVEMLFLFAFEFGRHSSAALVHFGFLLLLPWLILSYGRRFGFAPAAVFASAAVFCCPVLGMDGVCAYVDAAVAAAMFGAVYLLRLWLDRTDDLAPLAAAGALGGFAFSIKYTGAVALLLAAGVVLWVSLRARRPPLRPLAALAAASALWILPWTLKGWLYTGDPLIPFFDGVFPNPNVHISFVAEWSAQLRHYGIANYRDLPYQLFLNGERTEGFLGPLFLLAPVALLALRRREGRFLLLAALFAAAPYPANIGARFLIPALPFVALALGLALESLPSAAIVALVLAQAVVSLPAVTPKYCSPYAWRLDRAWPWRAALRIVPEDRWLTEHFPGYSIDRMLDRLVPPGERVYSLYQPAEAYTSREILVSYQSAPGETLQDAIFSAVSSGYQPSVLASFRFAPRPLRRVKVIQRAASPAMWSVTEFRVLLAGREIARSTAWRVLARPNPWDSPLAFDNNLATRWRSWQPERAGMFLELDLGRPVPLDGVALTLTPDQPAPDLRLDGDAGDGHWTLLGAAPQISAAPVPYSLRRDAMSALKRAGLRYFLVNTDAYGAGDLRHNPALWGLRLLGDSWEARLYRIE